MASTELDGRLTRLVGPDGAAFLGQQRPVGLGRKIVEWIDALGVTDSELDEVRTAFHSLLMSLAPGEFLEFASKARSPDDHGLIPPVVWQAEIPKDHRHHQILVFWVGRIRSVNSLVSEAFRVLEFRDDPVVGEYLEAIRSDRRLPGSWEALRKRLRSGGLVRTEKMTGRTRVPFGERVRRLVEEHQPSNAEIRSVIEYLESAGSGH